MIGRSMSRMNAPFFHRGFPFSGQLFGLATKGLLILGLTNSLRGDPLDHWTWRNPQPQGDDLVAAAYGGGAFVAVSWGNNGTIIRSTNGITWSFSSSGVQTALYGVAYGNDQFVAVGDVGTVVTSGEGVLWDSGDSGTQQPLNGVAYGAGQFVAVGWGGTVPRFNERN